MQNNLRIGVHNKGRLKNAAVTAFNKAGFNILDLEERVFDKIVQDEQDELESFTASFNRQDCLLPRVSSGMFNAAVVGRDALVEYQAQSGDRSLCEIAVLPGAGCKVQVVGKYEVDSIDKLNGLRIGTSMPFALSQWLAKARIPFDSAVEGLGAQHGALRSLVSDGARLWGYDVSTILTERGGIEALIGWGEADIVVDLVESGQTAIDNGLKPSLVLLESEAVLVARKDCALKAEVDIVARRISAPSLRSVSSPVLKVA